jgi:hypothetical protein
VHRRGRYYPALTTAIGERVGLIGAMSVETAGRYLNAREVDGIAIGDGFQPRVVEALLTVLGEDVRFRDLPVGLLGRRRWTTSGWPIWCGWKATRASGRAAAPFVRLQAFESRLKRMLKSLDARACSIRKPGCSAASVLARSRRAVQQAEEQAAR